MSASKVPPAPAVRWSLQLYTSEPARLPLINSDLTLPHSVVFIGGLTDTLGSVTYLDRLAQGVASYGFSVTQLQLSSSLGGFGVCSLEGDAQEISLAVKWLRSKGKDKIILMGSSTGCQDIMQYLSFGDRGEHTAIDAAVLQAPVSDREHWLYGSDDDDDDDKREEQEQLKLATKLVEEGKGYELLPRKVAPQLPSKEPSKELGNVGAVNDPPFTAYRFWSLYAKAADDDYFSTLDFTPEHMRQIWEKASKGLTRNSSKGHILALLGAEDETIPRPKNTPEKIKKAWKDAIEGSSIARVQVDILPGASHQVADAEAQIVLAAKVRTLIKSLGVQPVRSAASVIGPDSGSTGKRVAPGPPPPPPSASTTTGIPAWQLAESTQAALNVNDTAAAATTTSTGASAVPPHPPSFDALVELIASGRADEIEGIRDIPLKINDDPPSESRLDAPKKPWEAEQ